MITRYVDAREEKEIGTEAGGRIIKDGGLVAFPTETVYGLGANGLDGDAVKRRFEAKGRPQDNPLILHVARKRDAEKLWKSVPEEARILMDTFWPGPLTIILERSDIVPDEVTAGLDTVAVRMPDNETALALIRNAGVPIAAPSANTSGRPSPTCAEHVREDMDGRIDMIIDGGDCRFGLESTVVTLVGGLRILRPGAVTKEMLEAAAGRTEVASSVLSPLKKGEIAASPGMKYRHYAPDADVRVAMGEPSHAAQRICEEYDKAAAEGKRVVIFATEELLRFYGDRKCVIIGSREAPETMCASLFARLRDISGKEDIVLCESLPGSDMGLAYMNRLLRAAGFNTFE